MTVYVVYGSMEDDEAARIIAEAFGYPLDFILYSAQDPFTQHTEDDLIAVGGFYPNVFYRYYFCGTVDPNKFPEIEQNFWDSILNPTNYPNNPETWRISPRWRFGVSPDGHRHIETVTRANGTKVTGVAGIHKADTLESAKRFSKGKVNLAIGVVPWAVVSVVSAVILRR